MDPHRESTEKKQGDVVLLISGGEQPNSKGLKAESCEEPSTDKPQPPSPEIVLKSSPSPGKPPRARRSETLVRRKSIPTSAFSKPKSRFVEQTVPVANPIRDASSSTHVSSPKDDDEEDEEDEEEGEKVYKREQASNGKVRRRKIRVWNLIEWSILVLSIACFVASLLVKKLEGYVICGLEIWRWCLIAVVFCGRLVTNWLIHILVFAIEWNFLLKKKILYFVYGLKKSVRIFLWLLLILLSWSFVFHQVVGRSRKTEKVLFFVSRSLFSLQLGSLIWVIKTLLVKILASSFHMNRFFDRIQESIFHQYILQTISGPPSMELAKKIGTATHPGQMSFISNRKGKGKGKEKQEVVDVSKLYKMKKEKVSAWTMKGLVNVISATGLSTISNTIDESFQEEEKREITSEWEAKLAAYRIFKNVARPGYKYINAEDLRRFLSREEEEYLLPFFEGAAETGKIKKSALRNWVVKAYLDRRSLALSLQDTKTAVNQLHKLATAIVIIAVLVITLILTGIATTEVLVFISSQLLLVVFMFGNSCKMAFEAIIFVFVMHPFDVGDRCVVDEVQMIVEEMNILTTVFLKFDNEKIYYPNSVLATKPISNFYRSPDMSDAVEFSVDISTSVESIGALKSMIKMYIDSKPNHWHPNHCVVVEGIVDVNKMNMTLCVNHTMNFQNVPEKNSRRSDLVLELKRIAEELLIKYKLLPQEVHLSYTGSTPLPMAITQSLV
ncbi:mechanosensitive ion channel protein 10-like isoform X2 [Asparagus officinalis]|uniref:mechanosensitive ion channel protein 10-like isoform X1 n=1 Tax=Asparagus officinalis TaxID=4686 RepID=UPI00098E1C52|nr:mechanosensitive ion channel protein 10-like isoform X1 [Asparagus officinalis]XP_020270400.1 mechanosensitive ion channel protein 10-like isoform X2 [Asparagus officinalis]